MALFNSALYEYRVGSGYYKKSDQSGPYAWDGAAMQLASGTVSLTAAQVAALKDAGTPVAPGTVIIDPSSPYSVLGVVDGSGNLTGAPESTAYANISPSNTGAANVAILQAAHDSLVSKGGVVWMPASSSEFPLAGTVTISYGFANSVVGNQNIVFRGQGVGATRLRQQTAGVSTFSKTSGQGHGFEDFSLYGPGTSNAASVGIDWTNAAGGAMFKRVWIDSFGVGAQFVDCTSMTFEDCYWNANAVGINQGYNCDIFTFINGSIQNNTSAGVVVGYRDAGHAAGALQINCTKFIGTRIGYNLLALSVPDYGASQLDFDSCYFERNTTIMNAGDAAQTTGAKQIIVKGCFFTLMGASNGSAVTQFNLNAHANQESTISFVSCRSDDSNFAGKWVALGLNSRLNVEDSELLSTIAQIGWNGGTYTLDKRQNFSIDMAKLIVHDGSAMGSIAPLDVRLTNGTGATYSKWTRINGSTGAALGIANPDVIDVNGQFVCVRAPIRFITPTGALPTASATYRGISAYQEGGGGVADTLVCCMKDAAGAYSWKVVATG